MKELIRLYTIHSPSGYEDKMVEYLIDRLCSLGMFVNTDGYSNIYASYGESETYPCIVAHIDEVHKDKPDDFTVLQYKGNLFGFSPSEHDVYGIGADDKNGVWIALKIADAFVKAKRPIKIAFFVSEEVGCVGSNNAEMDFFKNCRFVIECDRKGADDFITQAGGVELCSKEFLKAVKPLLKTHGYKSNTGLSTDVMQLKSNGLNVSCCNMSCGYYNPHTAREQTYIPELRNALALAKSLMLLENVFPHKAPPKQTIGYNWYSRWGYGFGGGKNYSYNSEWGAPIRFAPPATPATPTPGRADGKDNGDNNQIIWRDDEWDC